MTAAKKKFRFDFPEKRMIIPTSRLNVRLLEPDF
jgi:hypothetical protein